MRRGSILLVVALLMGAAPAYRLTRTNGDVLYIVSYEKKGQFYVVTDTEGRVTQHFVGSVESIKPLSEEEAGSAGEGDNSSYSSGPGSTRHSGSFFGPSSARTSAKSTPRTTARNRARTTARRSYNYPDYLPFLDMSASNIGTTPTGIPLHMGPRGGIFHYSASGNKVYHSRK
jgi:hypothetical protein